MIDAVRSPRSPSTTPNRRHRARWTLGLVPLLAAATAASVVVVAPRPAAAATLQQQADQLAAELAQSQAQIQAQGEALDAANYHRQVLTAKINATRAAIAADQAKVSRNQTILREAAVNAFINDGSSNNASVFASNANQAATQSEYTKVATGDLSSAVDQLHLSVGSLTTQTTQLNLQEHQAAVLANQASSALSNARAAAAQQAALLQQTKGEIAAAFAAAQRARAAAEAAATARAQAAAAAAAQAAAGSTASPSGGGGSSLPIPQIPASGVGAAAVRAAESFLGVPYVWGGASRGGVDCSGLIMLAYQAVGIGLPHYSGAQMAASTPVPISQLQPGDLLFYGPGGDEHVAMYVGGGDMIEAPYTGAYVWIVPLRLGYGFAGAGRP